MALTSHQLDALRHDLHTLVKIDYAHLRNEILDHYALLTDEKMAEGYSFDEASTMAWLALGDGKGIQKIQTRYVMDTQKHLEAQHWAIVCSFFKWPTVLTTGLVGAMLTCLLLELPNRSACWLIGGLILSPLIILLISAFHYYWRRDSRQKLTWSYINAMGRWPIALLYLLNSFYRMEVYTLTPLVVVGLTVLGILSLLMTISLTQLLRERVRLT
ncbi:hypothetical protein ACAW74_12250 [Fibrella sp. WM1]|uniref:hypothetical protein n=1 Tax=Fibrella musci TaxID=3242485 RepID=UPI0035211E74